MKPSGRSTIITSRKNPKIPKLIDVRSKSSPTLSGTLLSSGRPYRFIIDSAIAPRITPAMLPIPPMMTMQRMKTENPNSNWSTFTVLWYVPRNAPENPPSAAPSA